MNETSKNFIFDTGLRNGYRRHLFVGYYDQVQKLSQPCIALCHFSEELLLLNSKHLHGPYFLKTISPELGVKIGLSRIDRIAGSDSYYALPNQSVHDVQALLNRKEVERYERTVGLETPVRGFSQRIGSSSKVAVREAIKYDESVRAVSAEKDRKLKLKYAADIAIKASLSDSQAKYLKRLEKENKAILSDLKLKLVESENKCRALEVQLGEEKGEMNDMLKKHNSDIVELSTSGLQRGTILSDKWHAKNGNAQGVQ